jgi:hypothetical protein
MVKVYSVTLVLGIVGLLVVILGGAFAENLRRDDLDPGVKIGVGGRMIIAALVGFGMAGMSAEFAPLGFEWGVSLVLAIVGGAAAATWARYAPDANNAG